jgi:hypothetical protein
MTPLDAKRLAQKLERNYRKNSGYCPEAYALTLLKRYGLRIANDNFYEYQNKRMRDESPEINVHNIHHFIIAPPSRDRKPDFGLGNPKSANYSLMPLVSEAAAEREEELSSCLDYLRALEGKYKLDQIYYEPDAKDLLILYQLKIISKSGKILGKKTIQV